MRKLAAIAFVATLPLLAAQAGRAATSSASLGVSVTVEAACTLNGADIDFGTYAPGQATPVLAQADIRLTGCTASAVRLEAAATATPDEDARVMRSSAGDGLNYELFRNEARTFPFGDGPRGFDRTVSATDTVLTVYGRIPAGQNVPAGDYADTLTLTLTY